MEVFLWSLCHYLYLLQRLGVEAAGKSMGSRFRQASMSFFDSSFYYSDTAAELNANVCD